MKRIILTILLSFFITPLFVYASLGSLVKVGDKYYDSFEEAILNAKENETITLITDIHLEETIEINKQVNIDLNGNNIEAPEKVFLIENGKLNLKGKGTIKETKPNYGAIMLIGSSNQNDKSYSVLNVSKDVTLEGWSGIFINHKNNKSYGVEVNFSGTINAINDINNQEGTGIYVNGNIKDTTNAPVININDNAKIDSTGNGLYIAGYGIFNINQAKITGVESGIGIKSGILNIDGAIVTGTGKDNTPTEGYNDGIKSSGASIQIESNDGYKGNIELNIDSGTFISNNSHAIYEYIGKGTHSQVIALNISGGTFKSKKDNFNLTNSLKEYHQHFISGGTYSSNPNEYLKQDYTYKISNGLYTVIQSTMLSVFNEINSSNTNLKTVIILTIIYVISISLFLNKTKILSILKTQR